MIKLGVQDDFAGGFEMEEGKHAALLLAERGYDALEISMGLRGERHEDSECRADITNIEKEGYLRDWCREIKKRVQVPVMLVSGLRSIESIEEIIRKREADFVSLYRPLIREPDLVNKWKVGSRERAKCISCNKCLERVAAGGNLGCIFAS
jgi:2,4-dienoyl-CoA reductase-like NADH-dependent reductase (Old Yellow Enzyme family)